MNGAVTKDGAGVPLLETVLRIKRAGGDGFAFTGWASTSDLDLMGDIVDPAGAQFETPLPLLWAHDHAQPVGVVEAAHVTARGIRVSFRLLPEVSRTPEAVALIQAGALALSIGFKPLASTPIPGGGRRFTAWRWTELSLVSVAANPAAKIDRGIGKCLALNRAPVAPKRLSDAGARALAGGATELQAFYRIFDLAVERLPAEVRALAHETRTDRDPKTGELAFRDSFGRVMCKMTDAGELSYPGQEAVAKVPPTTRTAKAGMTRGQQDVVIKHFKRLNTAVEALAKTIAAIDARLAKLESAERGLHLRGFWRDGMQAQPGDIYTHDGSSYAARLPTEETPNATSGDWQLIAKRGGNAR